MAFIIRDRDVCCQTHLCKLFFKRIFTLGKFIMVLRVFLCLFEDTHCYTFSDTAT